MITIMTWRDGKAAMLADAKLSDVEMSPVIGDFSWIHFQLNEGDGDPFAGIADQVPAIVRRSLLAIETRPRSDLIEGGVLLNLRAPLADVSSQDDGDPLVSLRLWAKSGLVLTVQFRPSSVIPACVEKFIAGALGDPGDVIIALVLEAATQVDTMVAALGDRLDEFESGLDHRASFAERRQATQMRGQAIRMRRFVGPHSQALERLTGFPLEWMDATERAALREASDRYARMSEELESVRERSAVLHDEITDLRAERIDARSLQIGILALIFLPLTFITGLLGMNVAGIPFALRPWAFWGVTAFCFAVAATIGIWFLVRGWSRR